VRRRSLLRWAASWVSALPLLRGSLWAGTAAAPVGLASEGEAVLRALATAVLPASLGRARLSEITARFLAWVSGYREGAELDHGYGHTQLRSARGSPAAAYGVQLAALDSAARAEGVAGFAALSLERQRALVEAALAAAKVVDLPERPDGSHVAADLMAFFFRSAEANDLCYGAAIGRDDCRGLSGSEQPPKALAETR
jgi:hypothetical protein